ncbi:MAG: aminoglycoside phosphotransferase family protein [Oscillospiraceae bacterium]|nr:aminoglycoside phosphotransferase family protein [Oscillospiraceae bacterium]
MEVSRFESERRKIGEGKQADVYYWDGSAYKVYRSGASPEQIEWEFRQQSLACQTGLPVAAYYKTGDPRVVRMDYINGVTLADRVLQNGYQGAVHDMVRLQKQVHSCKGDGFPAFTAFLQWDLPRIGLAQGQKETVLRLLSEFEEKDCLCHLDFHPLNIMWSNDRYFIIDWANARRGNPIFDFARTYVILFEIAQASAREYLELLLRDKTVSLPAMEKAVYVMALLRIGDYDNPEVRRLIGQLEDGRGL